MTYKEMIVLGMEADDDFKARMQYWIKRRRMPQPEWIISHLVGIFGEADIKAKLAQILDENISNSEQKQE